MKHSSLIATAALTVLLMSGCDRTHPDVKLLTQTRESMTPLAIPSLSTHPRVTNLRPDQAPYPDELLISKQTAILSLNDAVEDAVILDAVDFEESDKARRAFVLTDEDDRLGTLSGLARKASSNMLLISPGVDAPASALARHAQRAIHQARWDSVALRVTEDTALNITPLPSCDRREVVDSRVTRGDQVVAMASAESGECEVATLHWLEDGSWTASLRGAIAAGETCLTVPSRTQPGQYDELDTITCQRTNTPGVLLEKLAASRTLCDTVEVNPTGSRRAVDFSVPLAELSTLPAARHLLITQMPPPERPARCP